MFHTPNLPLHRNRSQDRDQRRIDPSRPRTSTKGAPRPGEVHELYVDPVHGRHCICTRCAQRRAA